MVGRGNLYAIVCGHAFSILWHCVTQSQVEEVDRRGPTQIIVHLNDEAVMTCFRKAWAEMTHRIEDISSGKHPWCVLTMEAEFATPLRHNEVAMAMAEASRQALIDGQGEYDELIRKAGESKEDAVVFCAATVRKTASEKMTSLLDANQEWALKGPTGDAPWFAAWF